MNKALLLFLAFSFFGSFLAIETSSTSSTTDWASKYNNGSYNANNSSQGSSTTPNYKDFYTKVTCPSALQKANKAITEFIASVKGAKNQWGAFSAAEKLNGFNYYIQHGCNVDNLKIVNQGTTGLNKTQDDACANLTKLVEPLLGKGEAGSSSSNWMANFDISNKAFALQKNIGPNCNLTVVQSEPEAPVEPVVKEESEDKEAEAESPEEASHVENTEQVSSVDVPSLIMLSSSNKKQQSHSNNQEEEENEEEEEESLEQEVNIYEEEPYEDDFNQDFAIIIDERTENQQDSYLIYYHPEPNGDADIIIAHTTIREIIESELNSEEEENNDQIENIEK